MSFSPPQVDEYDLLSSMRNVLTVWPNWRPQQHRQAVPPWPTDETRAFLVWAMTATPKPELWLPTGAEQDALYSEMFAEGIASMARQRAASAAVGAWGAGR